MSTLAGFYISARKDVADNKIQLREIIQALTSLPRQYASLTLSVRSQSDKQGETEHLDRISDTFEDEHRVLAKQGAAILQRLPKDQVTGAEYIIIAKALGRHYPEVAKTIIAKALPSDSVWDHLELLRGFAQTHSTLQEFDIARSIINDARAHLSAIPDLPNDIRLQEEIRIDLIAVMAEDYAGQRDHALALMNGAMSKANQIKIDYLREDSFAFILRAERDLAKYRSIRSNEVSY